MFVGGNDPNGLFTMVFRVGTIEHMFETSNEVSVESGGVAVDCGSVSPGLAGLELAGPEFVSFDIAFTQLSNAVVSMGACGVPADAGVLVGLRSQIDRLSALTAEAEIRFDQQQLWRDEGAGSLRAWLVDACGLSRREATHLARRADRLESWPEVLEAWKSGALYAGGEDS